MICGAPDDFLLRSEVRPRSKNTWFFFLLRRRISNRSKKNPSIPGPKVVEKARPRGFFATKSMVYSMPRDQVGESGDNGIACGLFLKHHPHSYATFQGPVSRNA